MKQRYIIIYAIASGLLFILMGWYFLWPAATAAQLEAELGKVQLDTALSDNLRKDDTGQMCFASCAVMSSSAGIPDTSDFSMLYDHYAQHLESKGYHVLVSKEAFINPAKPDGSRNWGYLRIEARNDKKYRMQVRFGKSGTASSVSQEPVVLPSVDYVTYTASGHRR